MLDIEHLKSQLEWKENFRLGVYRDALVTKGDIQWKDHSSCIPKKRGYPCFQSAIHNLRTLGKKKSKGWIVDGGP